MRVVCAAILAFSLLMPAAGGAAASKLSAARKAQLRDVATAAISRRTVNGKFHYFDGKEGAIATLDAINFRPMIMQMGEHYVLCTSLRNSDGKHVAIDLYVVKDGDTFKVVDTVVGKRAALKSLMKIGAVRPAK